MYKGWNVHAYTPDMRLAAEPWLKQLRAPLSAAEHAALAQELRQHYAASRAVKRMLRAYRPEHGGFVDAQLSSVNVSRLLAEVWRLVRQEASLRQGFGELLADIGGTCLQGQSHRLLAYYVALNATE